MKRLFLALGLVRWPPSPPPARPAAHPGVGRPDDPNAPVIVAQNNAFNPSTLDVEADKAFSLTLDNKDAAPHNVTIYSDSSAATSVSVARSSARPQRRSRCRHQQGRTSSV